MKNMTDLENRFRLELKQWFKKQTLNIFDDYYLFYLETTSCHNGGILICKDNPPNPDYKLATPQRINKGATIDHNMNLFRSILKTLPVLSTG